jgi:hypothetical protein
MISRSFLPKREIIANGTLAELKKRFPPKGGVCGKTADIGGLRFKGIS